MGRGAGLPRNREALLREHELWLGIKIVQGVNSRYHRSQRSRYFRIVGIRQCDSPFTTYLWIAV